MTNFDENIRLLTSLGQFDHLQDVIEDPETIMLIKRGFQEICTFIVETGFVAVPLDTPTEYNYVPYNYDLTTNPVVKNRYILEQHAFRALINLKNLISHDFSFDENDLNDVHNAIIKCFSKLTANGILRSVSVNQYSILQADVHVIWRTLSKTHEN